MYCTKCGRKLAQDTDFCPGCGAQLRRMPKPRPSLPAKRVVLGSLVGLFCIAAIFIVTERAGLWSGAHPSLVNSANLAESAGSERPHMLNADASKLPASSMLMLPQAATGFVGSWGGYIYAQTTPHQILQPVMTKVPMSYYFGERNGEVFLKTQVYGDPKWPVVKSGVKVLNPKSIEFTLDSFCKSCTPPVHQQEITMLTLINGQELEAESSTKAYTSGGGHVEFDYKGTLYPLNQQQLAEIDREVEHAGSFLKSINSKIPAQ